VRDTVRRRFATSQAPVVIEGEPWRGARLAGGGERRGRGTALEVSGDRKEVNMLRNLWRVLCSWGLLAGGCATEGSTVA